MNKKRIAIIICCFAVLVLAVLAVLLLLQNRGVAKEYQYNTVIVDNTNAPIASEAVVEKISGYSEKTDTKWIKLPQEIPDTTLIITSVGSYSGVFNEKADNTEVEDVLALVVKNNSDKVVSYSSFTYKYSDDKSCIFSATNIPPGQSAIVFDSSGEVKFNDVTCFEAGKCIAVYASELPLLKDKVGVSYNDGSFIVTNLTDEDLGDVYIRYKKITDGNTYLGGITYSVFVEDVKAYETYKVEDSDFNEKTDVILAVENVVDTAS